MKKLIASFLLSIIPFMTAFSAYNEVLRIAHLCDPQLGFPEANLYLDIEEFKAEVANVNRLRPDVVVIAGDMVHVPDSTHYALFFEVARGIEAPVIYTPGNHDIYDPVSQAGLDNYRRIFGDDLVSFPVKGRRIISFNTQLLRKAPEGESARHGQHLDAALDSAAAAGEPVIMVSHVPPFVAAIDEKEEYFNLPLADRRHLLDKFASKGAFLWLCGHTHKTHSNTYGPVSILNAETTSQNFDGHPKGFRLLTIAPDNTFTWQFIPNKETN